MADEQPVEVPIAMLVPDELKVGAYANCMAIWNNGPHDFTLDFAVTGMAQQDSDGRVVVPADVVARVKVAPSVIFQIAKAIADNVDSYEKRFGPITPRPPDITPTFPPEEP